VRGYAAAEQAAILSDYGVPARAEQDINDSGTGQSGQFVSAHLMTTAFERTGGFCVVTESAPTPSPA
jgi:hypothetical protein